MRAIIKTSIKMIIEISKAKSLESLDYFISCLDEICDEDEIDTIYTESVNLLINKLPDSYDWLVAALTDLLDYGDEEEEGDFVYLTKFDLIHIILDQGFKPDVDFINLQDDKILVKNPRIREELEECYDFDQLAYFLTEDYS